MWNQSPMPMGEKRRYTPKKNPLAYEVDRPTNRESKPMYMDESKIAKPS